VELQRELAALGDVHARWWAIAGVAAALERLPARSEHLTHDAEPVSDTFIGHRTTVADDPIRDAIARAHAARAAIRELDGELPAQPLARTVRRGRDGATLAPCDLDVAAFALGDRVLVARLAANVADEAPLARALTSLVERPDAPRDRGVPATCVSIGDETLATAQHGHRRAWSAAGGPWLGLSRAGELATISTCHLVLDGYGHAGLAARIAEHQARFALHAPSALPRRLPPLAPVAGAIPLGIAWRELPAPAPRALPLAYALGRVLHRRAGDPAARFSPTFQLPIAPGELADPMRRRRRVVFATLSVRFAEGAPEPYDAFAARARATLAAEALGRGPIARLLAATRAVPAPPAWKRASITPQRPRVLDGLAELIGGRACLSRISIEAPVPVSCAVSVPARLACPADPRGSSVVTIVDDGSRAAITASGVGETGSTAAAGALLDELLASVEPAVVSAATPTSRS
jgi:hypothetical protein